MLAYHGTKNTFDYDVLNGLIADKIKEALLKTGLNDQNPAEYSAWQNSMQFMKNAIDDSRIPGEAIIHIEYEIPLTSKRVDFIILGSDAAGEDNVVIIELKQWTTCEKVADLEKHTVRTFVGQKNRDVAHPSYQAYSYKVHIENYAEAASDPNLHLIPCAYCHNFREEDRGIIEDHIYGDWIKEAPLFLKKDAMKLRDFIADKIQKKSSKGDLLYEIDNGRIRPAKALQDCLVSMLKGNREFMLMDDQVTVYDKCLQAYKECEDDGQRRVLIIQGGPGTGKSVMAINLLCDFIKKGGNAAYVTKNSSPRKCYTDLLSHSDLKKKIVINDLFRSPFKLCEVPSGFYDCLIVDEAHRLVNKMYGDFKGFNQIKEIIQACKLSIFLIDETQRISTKDIGSVDGIIKWAMNIGVTSNHIKYGEDYVLSSQFRCNGSDGYILFINNLLGIQNTANRNLEGLDFDFKVFDNPCEMREKLRKKNGINNKARLVAGYCYDWNVKNGRGDWDIEIGADFKAKWNKEGDQTWAIDADSFDHVGCIHTCQGLEFDYVGVIIGKDLIYRNGKVTTNQNAISKDDKSSGIRGCSDKALADQLIRNTYKVLLTRGQKGCYVYCEDKPLADYIRAQIKN